MRKVIFLTITSFCIFNASSQDMSADTTDKTVNIKEVVVSANKFAETRKNIAQQVQLISAKDLKRLNAQTTADALAMSGQVFIQKSQQGGGSPVLRGFEASRVLLVVDGVRMNNIIYRSGHLQNVISVDNNVLDRIEVLFGPSSTVYGSDALGGVVHMRTKNPVLAFGKKIHTGGNAVARYGSVNNEVAAHADFTISGKKFGSLTSGTFSRFGDLKQGAQTRLETADFWDRNFYQDRINGKDTVVANFNSNVQKSSGYYQYDVLQKFLFQQTENISHTINVQFSNTGNIPRYDRLAVTSSSTILRDAEWYYGPQRRLLAIYDFNWKNAGTFFDNTSIGINYQNLEESRHNRSFGNRFRTSRIETVNIGGFHADFKKVIKAHDIYFGVEGQFNFLNSKAFATDVTTDTVKAASTRYPDGKNTFSNAGIYLTHTWEITPKIILSDGIRYTFITQYSSFVNKGFFPFPFDEVKNTHHAVSGNLSFVFHPGAGFKITVMGSSGFRAPNTDDLAKIFDSQPGRVVVPNTELNPEYTANTDVTIEKTFAENVRVSATGFYTQFFNAIVTDKFQFNGADSINFDGTMSEVLANQNKRSAFITGVSATVEADAAPWLTLTASVTYTYARIKTDSVPYPLDHIPPVYGRAGMRCQYRWVRGEFFAVFNGAKKVEDYNMEGEDNFPQATPTGMPAWFTINARIGFQPIKYFGIDFGVDNILDTRYRTFASGISAPGRNFFIALRWGF